MKGMTMRNQSEEYYKALSFMLKDKLPPVFKNKDFMKAGDFNTLKTSNSNLNRMLSFGFVHKKVFNHQKVLWSFSEFPEEGPKKPLPRVFTKKEYGDYYNLTDPHRILYRAAQKGKVFRVGRKIDQGQPLLWSFNPADEGSEFALNKAIASDIIPSAVSDPFANLFR